MDGQDNEAHLAAVEAMLSAEDMAEAAELLREAACEVTETGYDNWNGGKSATTLSAIGHRSARRRMQGGQSHLSSRSVRVRPELRELAVAL